MSTPLLGDCKFGTQNATMNCFRGNSTSDAVSGLGGQEVKEIQ